MMIVSYVSYIDMSTGGYFSRTTTTAAAVIAKPRRTWNVLLLYHVQQSNRMYLEDHSSLLSPVCEYSYVLATRLMNHTACNAKLSCATVRTNYRPFN